MVMAKFALMDYSVRARLNLLGGVMLAGLLLLAIASLQSLRANLIEDRRGTTQNVVETARGVIEHYHARARSGELDEALARREAMQALRGMRYGGKEYFWINDNAGVWLMHPHKPELEGRSGLDMVDPDGKPLMREFIAKANAGGGNVEYLWPFPGKDHPVSKVSYVAPFQPWGWVVGSGIYLDDVEATFRAQALTLVIIIAVLIVVLMVISWRIGHGILGQLGGEPARATDLVRRIAEGDLTMRGQAAGQNPRSLIGSMCAMRAKLADMIQGINQISVNLRQGADDLSVAAGEISIASTSQAESTAAMAASVEEMTVSVNEIAELTSATENNSAQTTHLAEEGAKLIADSAGEMEETARIVADSAQKLRLLETRVEEIGGIAGVIKDIADQTNLLALNAAIEAARAGEQGRGFSVVADEVRNLAERTARATGEIESMVHAIQGETTQAVTAMTQAVPLVENGVTRSRRASSLLGDIQRESRDSLARVRDVAHATREQAVASQEIARHVERIASMAEETNAITNNNADAARRLKDLAARLGEEVAHFKAG
jgi:methyl-accepting chemotaxis protein